MPQKIDTKVGDLLPTWIFQIRSKDPTTDKWVNDDLSDVTEVLFYMKDSDTGVIKIDGGTGNVYDLVNSLIEYPPVSGDTDTAGTYEAEARLKRTGGKYQTVPAQEYDKLYVLVSEDIRS